MTLRSAIYAGDVVHARHRPRAHKLRYRVFSLLLDLDELPLLDKALRLFAHNHFAVFSFHDRDHGIGEQGGLKAWCGARLAEAGMMIDAGDLRVEMLCYPRIFGYVFNPLTVYFCHDRGDGDRLVYILYEVCNTFHERHTYIIPTPDAGAGTIRHSCGKEMYVSPFVPMECTYDFRINPPHEAVRIAINEQDAEGDLLFASFSGKRQPLSDATLAKSFFSHPLMTLKIMGAIHWEALILWVKGNPLYRHKAATNPVASSVPARAANMGGINNEPR